MLFFGTVWFAFYYVDQYRRWGTLSIGAWLIGFDFFLKIIVMYPFAKSPENIVDVGRSLAAVQAHVDEAFRISVVGVLAMMLGMAVAPPIRNHRSGPVLDRLYRILLHGWVTRSGVIAACFLAFGAMLLLILLGFKPFVARSLVFERPELRPAFNLWYEIIPFATLCVAAYAFHTSSARALAISLAIALVSVAGGNRTVVVFSLVQIGIMWSMPARRKDIVLPLVAGSTLATLALIISVLRGDDTHKAGQGGIHALLYGSNLSDLRDFAWILSGLHDQFYGGLTFLAGYLSFIPTVFLNFRYDMAFGRVSALLAGLDPSHHSGLRPPLFGELYLNFAMPGVIVGGMLFGCMFGHILRWVENRLQQKAPDQSTYSPPVVVWSGLIAYQIATCLVFTSGFFGVYVIGLLLAMGLMLERVEQAVVLRR
jgi:oligosaccharide repeat unit polymerase